MSLRLPARAPPSAYNEGWMWRRPPHPPPPDNHTGSDNLHSPPAGQGFGTGHCETGP